MHNQKRTENKDDENIAQDAKHHTCKTRQKQRSNELLTSIRQKKVKKTNGTNRKDTKTLVNYLHHINKKEPSTKRSKTSCDRQIRTPEKWCRKPCQKIVVTNLATKHQIQSKHNSKKAWCTINYISSLNTEKIPSVQQNKTARSTQTLSITGQTDTPTNEQRTCQSNFLNF